MYNYWMTFVLELTANIPVETRSSILTLTKVSHLQGTCTCACCIIVSQCIIIVNVSLSEGFLHGLVSSELPEIYYCDQPPRIRPHVQKHYSSSDPFSPLGLMVPKGLVPPWRDVFVEGQRDVIHGGTLMRNVIQSAKLKQCSRC